MFFGYAHIRKIFIHKQVLIDENFLYRSLNGENEKTPHPSPNPLKGVTHEYQTP